MMFLVVGLRIASALPSDVRAAWLFEVHHLSRKHARQALERTMLLLGVALPVLVSAPSTGTCGAAALPSAMPL